MHECFAKQFIKGSKGVSDGRSKTNYYEHGKLILHRKFFYENLYPVCVYIQITIYLVSTPG